MKTIPEDYCSFSFLFYFIFLMKTWQQFRIGRCLALQTIVSQEVNCLNGSSPVKITLKKNKIITQNKQRQKTLPPDKWYVKTETLNRGNRRHYHSSMPKGSDLLTAYRLCMSCIRGGLFYLPTLSLEDGYFNGRCGTGADTQDWIYTCQE